MAKHLTIKFWKRNSAYHFFVAGQSHRGEDFGETDDRFEHDGFILASRCSPEVMIEDDEGEQILYVRGDMTGSDNVILRVYQSDGGEEYFQKMREAVLEYNRTFNSPHPGMIDVTQTFMKFAGTRGKRVRR